MGIILKTFPGFAVRKIEWNYIQACTTTPSQKMDLNLGMRKKKKKNPTQKAEVDSLYMLSKIGLICITCGKSNILPKTFLQAFCNYGSKI